MLFTLSDGIKESSCVTEKCQEEGSVVSTGAERQELESEETCQGNDSLSACRRNKERQ